MPQHKPQDPYESMMLNYMSNAIANAATPHFVKMSPELQAINSLRRELAELRAELAPHQSPILTGKDVQEAFLAITRSKNGRPI